MNANEREQTTAWWEPRDVAAGQTLDCQLGPLHLRVQHVSEEWRVVTEYADEVPGPMPPVSLKATTAVLTEDGMQRYVAPSSGSRLRLKPVLADRPVVIRPRQPVFLPSNTETTLYLSSPIWLQLEVGEHSPMELCQIPSMRLSDTWFGPSTREGELCYSGKTHARHDVTEVPFRPHRAITPVRIRNEARSVLPLEKLSLPVPMLAVHGADDGRLWTQRLSLVRRNESDMADIRIEPGPPAAAGSVTRISAPRQEPGRGGIVRAFSLLFGNN